MCWVSWSSRLRRSPWWHTRTSSSPPAHSRGDQRVDANRELTALVPWMSSAASSALTRSPRPPAYGHRSHERRHQPVLLVGGGCRPALTALLLSGLLSHLPEASLGGIILYAAWTLIDRTGWRSPAPHAVGGGGRRDIVRGGSRGSGHPPGYRDRHRTLGDGAAHPAVTPSRGRARLRAGPRRDARRRRLSRRSSRCRVSSSTGMTRRCSSPTPTTSTASASRQPIRPAAGGSC